MNQLPKRKICLVNPPYLRILGSHNDRIPIELCYLNTYLLNAGHESMVINADYTGAKKYIKWSKLFDNFHFMSAAVNGQSALFDETVERIMSLDPEIVVISAADGITPWVDSGSAYVSAILSDKLRNLGVHTIGVGPFYSKVPEKFIKNYDCILTGVASPTIIDAVEQKLKGIVKGKTMNLFDSPPITSVFPDVRDDVVMTAIGCPYSCSFCLAADSKYIQLPINTVMADIANRMSPLIDIGDAILPLSAQRSEELCQSLSTLDKTYTCEISVSSVNERNLDFLKRMGVISLKLGIESGDDEQLKNMNKVQTTKTILKAVDLIKKYSFRLNCYVLLGGPDAPVSSSDATLKLCREINANDYIINVWSFHNLENRDFRYDSHFSQVLVEEWGLTDVMEQFFELQKPEKFGLGQLL